MGGEVLGNKPQLVLDIAGVLITNMSPLFWQLLSDSASISYEDLVSDFKVNVREQLWTGAFTEEEFWNRLCVTFPTVNLNNAKDSLQSSLQPLPALNHLARWSEIADIHLLSNHRTEWLMKPLATVRKYIRTFTISSDVGCCKPHREIYDVLANKLDAEQIVLFVDDQEKNFIPAIELGWMTLQADEFGTWIPQVELLLFG
ncbi:hypothetical protein AYW79_09070 [Ferroacidibacillus organovorans]|uniref:Haloacid dehalogenase n=1 Tax=Ferroacidibacillus organovorans TaxID=1765683 RepID=A0A853KBE0_9BACL|nr:hypothetical protein AYJ22_06015 [Ferroacidibacillus organovorans]OAG93718.1 hypothetical protein AYW79_09070 [Ferroacidibacillus organovorans]